MPDKIRDNHDQVPMELDYDVGSTIRGNIYQYVSLPGQTSQYYAPTPSPLESASSQYSQLVLGNEYSSVGLFSDNQYYAPSSALGLDAPQYVQLVLGNQYDSETSVLSSAKQYEPITTIINPSPAIYDTAADLLKRDVAAAKKRTLVDPGDRPDRAAKMNRAPPEISAPSKEIVKAAEKERERRAQASDQFSSHSQNTSHNDETADLAKAKRSEVSQEPALEARTSRRPS